jgi:hypothetical protein
VASPTRPVLHGAVARTGQITLLRAHNRFVIDRVKYTHAVRVLSLDVHIPGSILTERPVQVNYTHTVERLSLTVL